MLTPKTYNLVIMGLFIAITVAAGFALMTVPNVEMVTTTIFIAGYFLGPKKGAVVGLCGEFLYSILNPYGIAAPPLLMAQVTSMAIVGYSGGVIGRKKLKVKKIEHRLFVFALCGLLLTLLFDTTTTLSFVIFTGLSFEKMTATFIYGMGFYFIHILANTAIFALVVPMIIVSLQRVEFLNKNALKTEKCT